MKNQSKKSEKKLKNFVKNSLCQINISEARLHLTDLKTMTKILDGKKLAEKILRNLKKEVEKKQLKLKLAVVLVGNDFSSKVFIRKKQEACEKIGVGFELFKFSAKISTSGLKKEIKKIGKDPIVSGIVIQLPLPKKFNTDEILNLIPPKKNIEIISPVVCAIERLLKEYKISLLAKKVVLVGRGRLVGQPLAAWFKKQKIDFSNIDKIKQADIVISGVGKQNLITGEMVKRRVVVIDVGGDVDFQAVSKKASYISPVPGGVGPLTVACLLKNLAKLSFK